MMTYEIPFIAELFGGYPHLIRPAQIVAVLALAYLLFFIGRYYILRAIAYLARKSAATWDDILFERRVFHALMHLIPILVVHNAAALFAPFAVAVRRLTLALIVFVGALFFARLLASFQTIYERNEFAKDRPIKGFFQILTIILYLLAAVLATAILMGRSPIVLLSGIGAMTAVLMLVFKDAILGFVSSLQLSLNHSIRKGDWIAMDRFGADGEVIDITLYTLKVRNWNNTITHIPTQKFLDESFTNWRGMQESGARRMARAVPLDAASVRFLTTEEIAALEADGRMGRFVTAAREALPAGDHTNLTLFRYAFTRHLKERTDVRPDLTLMVRTLEPTAAGVPLQIYLFTATTVWEEYEGIQGSILETLVATLPSFGLRILQSPSGNDVRALSPLR